MFKLNFYLAIVLCQVFYSTAEFRKEDCVKDVQGIIACRANFEAYKWDVKTNQCISVWYGGCNPTENNFETKELCEAIAKPVCGESTFFREEDCTTPVENQPSCRASFDVFTYDYTKKACVEAIYGGCNPTKNIFDSKEECEQIALPVCQSKKFYTEEDCLKDTEGMIACRGNFEAYRWDTSKQACVIHPYGGCNPTPNNFATLEDCERVAKPVCSGTSFKEEDCTKDVEGAIACRAYIEVFKWDSEKQQCVEAIYGGCNRTPNNFESLEDCEKFAKPVCSKKISEIFKKEDCTKDVEVAPGCRANFPVYTWNDSQQACIEARYGGCKPTSNNFETKEECEKVAAPVCKNDEWIWP